MDIKKKNLVLIDYLQDKYKDYKVKAEFSTNDKDIKVIVVQEQPGEKEVFYGNITPLYNYYQITIFGESIRENKNIAVEIGDLIGKHVIHTYGNEKWQIIFSQYSNPQAIEYLDIRRVGYSSVLKCVVNQIA